MAEQQGGVMHLHVRIHHWVLWWFDVGVVIGAIAIINILTRDLTRTQERAILVIGALFWLLGGLVCHACQGIEIEKPPQPPIRDKTSETEQQKEWRPASDFVLPGRRKGLLPTKH
jgi:hypothetical protein